MAARKRDDYRCQICGRQGTPRAGWLHVHHKIPIRFGGPDALSNVVTLCAGCHWRVEQGIRDAEHIWG
jgi:5-methylcytosine-specific restriction endonuclease McrA